MKAQVKAQIGALLFNKAFIVILAEYFNDNNILLAKYIEEFLEYIKMNNHAIKLKKCK